MNMLASLMILLGLGADVPPGGDEALVTYRVRFVEMRGLEWRGEVHSRLTPVARQGGATIWTAPAELADVLTRKAERTIGAPKVRAQAGTPATIQTGTRHAYVADLKRVADGPVNHARALAYQPQIDHVNDSIAVTLQGRWVDQGLLAEVEIEENRLEGLDTFTIHEQVEGDPKLGAKPAALNAQVQVPEVVEGHVGGEWLIPTDGLLVVSLGAYSRPAGKGPTTTRERLAIIEPLATESEATPTASRSAWPVSAPMPIAVSTMAVGASQLAVGLPSVAPRSVACYVAPPATVLGFATTAPVAPSQVALLVPTPMPTPPVPPFPVAFASPRPTPAPPSRGLPTPINSKGEVVALPPLPEEIETHVEEFSAEPRPAPQTRIRSQSAPMPENASEPAPEAPAPNRETTELAKRPTTGQIRVGIGFGTGGLTVSGQLDIARKPSESSAKPPLEGWAKAMRERLTTSVGIVGENRSERTLVQEITSGLERFARNGECTKGPMCIFELNCRDQDGRKGRLAVYIEADELGRKLLGKPLPIGSLVRMPVYKSDLETMRTSAGKGAIEAVPTVDAKPADEASKGKDATVDDEAEAVEPQAAHWGLSLPDAIRIGLENSKVLKVVAVGAGVMPSPTVVASERPGKTRAEAQAVVRRIEQAYWDLSRAQTGYWAAETAVELAEQCRRRALAKASIDDDPRSEVAAAEQCYQKFHYELAGATLNLLDCEGHLRETLGLPAKDGRRIVTTSEPGKEKAHYDWEHCRDQLEASHPELVEHRAAIWKTVRRLTNGDLNADLLESTEAIIREGALSRRLIHEATHQLARFYLEVEGGYDLYTNAAKLKEAALQRLEAQKKFYEQGTVTIDRYLDAIRRWAVAVTLEAEMLARYNTAIAVLEETKGTLLVREGIEVMEERAEVAAVKRDDRVGRTVLNVEEAPVGRMMFGLSPVPVCPVFRAEPLLIRVPVGRFGVMELLPMEARSHWLGAFW